MQSRSGSGAFYTARDIRGRQNPIQPVSKQFRKDGVCLFLSPVQSSLPPYVRSNLFRHSLYDTKNVMIPAGTAAITAMPTVPKSHFLRFASAEM